ncbi:hypothetical protein SSPS47_00310 [Streptomyces sp. S4.7]|nr:hypothetical protein SSPS47_00310 [Streptomyces sp. S4.7]
MSSPSDAIAGLRRDGARSLSAGSGVGVAGVVVRAVPVEAQHGGVVGQVAVAGVGDRCCQDAHDLAGMFAGGVANEAGQVDGPGLSFLHAIGVEQEAVPGAQVEVLHVVDSASGGAEEQIDVQVYLAHRAVAQEQWPGVSGVDELCAGSVEGDARELAGGEGVVAVVAEGLVDLVGLAGQVGWSAGRSVAASWSPAP